MCEGRPAKQHFCRHKHGGRKKMKNEKEKKQLRQTDKQQASNDGAALVWEGGFRNEYGPFADTPKQISFGNTRFLVGSLGPMRIKGLRRRLGRSVLYRRYASPSGCLCVGVFGHTHTLRLIVCRT